MSERYNGRFERRITLPAEVEEDKVRASQTRAPGRAVRLCEKEGP
jgi:hypothetical protein